jgi:hypothetical protein
VADKQKHIYGRQPKMHKMLSWQNGAHQVLDQIAARDELWNFAKIFGGVHSNNV